MELLNDELRSRFPPLHAQEAEAEPMVYARYYLPGTEASWYICEGQSEGEEYLFFGFVTWPDAGFRCFLLSELEVLRGPEGQTITRDLTFTEEKLTNVAPTPDF